MNSAIHLFANPNLSQNTRFIVLKLSQTSVCLNLSCSSKYTKQSNTCPLSNQRCVEVKLEQGSEGNRQN